MPRRSSEDRWWARQDLNLGPTDYESAALTAELRARRCIWYNPLILYWFGTIGLRFELPQIDFGKNFLVLDATSSTSDNRLYLTGNNYGCAVGSIAPRWHVEQLMKCPFGFGSRFCIFASR